MTAFIATDMLGRASSRRRDESADPSTASTGKSCSDSRRPRRHRHRCPIRAAPRPISAGVVVDLAQALDDTGRPSATSRPLHHDRSPTGGAREAEERCGPGLPDDRGPQARPRGRPVPCHDRPPSRPLGRHAHRSSPGDRPDRAGRRFIVSLDPDACSSSMPHDPDEAIRGDHSAPGARKTSAATPGAARRGATTPGAAGSGAGRTGPVGRVLRNGRSQRAIRHDAGCIPPRVRRRRPRSRSPGRHRPTAED